jgi:hypothetical protein
MRVLVACEESQAVCKAFRERGHEAFSADVLECSGGKPEWHITGDVLDVLYDRWDMVLAFPPCTYISNAGASWLYRGKTLSVERYEKGLVAREFFMKFWEAPCPKVCVENPTPSKVFQLPPWTQTIQPYQFGDPFKKTTRLWLRGLPPLRPTKQCLVWTRYIDAGSNPSPGVHARRLRSKTFAGVAAAMAEQWG